MRRELYINNRLADIDGVSIPLNFACSEIADLSGVSGNYSLTVKLPLTGNNILIAYFANLPNTTPASLWPGYKTTASYFIDGVPIFQNADVRLLSTEKSIDINISFGNLTWLDVLANIKLKTIIDGFTGNVQNWNYWAIENEASLSVYIRWILTDFGETFESGIHMERMHPSINVKFLWETIFDYLQYTLGVTINNPIFTPESDLWLPIMSQVLNPALPVGNYLGFPTDYTLTNQAAPVNTGNGFELFYNAPTDPGLYYSLLGRDYIIFPKTGQYRITFQATITAIYDTLAATNNLTLRLRLNKKDDLSIIDEFFSFTWAEGSTGTFVYTVNVDKLIKVDQGTVVYFDLFAEQESDGNYSAVIDATDFAFNILYEHVTNKKEQLEFLMPYDIAYNMPDISCKDFVKAIMQLYGLLVENKSNNIENTPVMFSLDSLTGTTYENWSDKLVSFDLPKIEWNLGFKQRNYLRYAEDETDNIFEDAYFTTYETDNSEKDLFKSIFAASDDVSLIGTSYFPVPVCSIPQWVVDEKTDEWKFEGKCKQRIVRAYQTETTFEREVVQLYGEGYSPILITETAHISYFKTIPAELTDNGQGLDMASIMAKYYTGFIQAVKSNRLFTFQFLLNQIDINKFTHITPIWIEKFSNFFFVKKVLNWEAGRVCNVEMLQLRDAGAVGLHTTIRYGLLYNWYAATDARGITSAGDFVVPSKENWETLLEYIDNYDEGSDSYLLAGMLLKEIGTYYWEYDGGTNVYNFNARGCGERQGYGFANIKEIITFISTSEHSIDNYFSVTLRSADNDATISNSWYATGHSIRLVRPATEAELLLDDGTACANYVGNDGKEYPTVKVGTQVWTAANLCETMFRTGVYIPGFTAGVYTPITNEAWAAATTAMVCAYNDDTDNI